jgi:hypothetical protein
MVLVLIKNKTHNVFHIVQSVVYSVLCTTVFCSFGEILRKT